MPFRGVIGDITETGSSSSESSLEWKIPNFLSLPCEDGDHHRSSSFYACDAQWCIKIYPRGVAGITSSRWVDLFLLRLDGGPHRTFNLTIKIIGEEGVVRKKETLLQVSEDEDAIQLCSWIGFCLRSKLTEQRYKLMQGNVLTLALNMRSDVWNITTSSSTERTEESMDEVPTEEHQSLEKQGGEKALEDFGKLLASSEQSDVTVQVGDIDFNVHRAILFARSPALSVSLKHESKEKACNKITIDDCEPDIFREYLLYLYTGAVRSLTEQNVFGLYCIADKYLANDLKLQCLHHIGNTLCVQTFCDAMKLALLHGESSLLKLATDFAAENIRSILISTEWQNFNCEYPRQANEILNQCFGQQS